MIDTPGIREIGLWQAYHGMAKTFPEISGELEHCRFADCEHVNEPDCAVRAAQAQGLIPERRLEHWRDLMADLDLQESQLEEYARAGPNRVIEPMRSVAVTPNGPTSAAGTSRQTAGNGSVEPPPFVAVSWAILMEERGRSPMQVNSRSNKSITRAFANRPVLSAVCVLAFAAFAVGCGRSAPEDTAAPIEDQVEPAVAGIQVASETPVIVPPPTVATVAPPVTTVAPQPAAEGGTYIIEPGDTLSVIAERFGISTDALSQANGITDVNTIRPGQELIIPAAG